MDKIESRATEIEREHRAQAARIGQAAADRELYHAFAREEAEHDELKRKILSMVKIEDRRGIFLLPSSQVGL